MSKSIALRPDMWKLLKMRLSKDHPPSVTLIRANMKRVLGFVDREHREWVPDKKNLYDGYGEYVHTVYLDFYDEAKKTFFLLRYGEFVTDDKNSDK